MTEWNGISAIGTIKYKNAQRLLNKRASSLCDNMKTSTLKEWPDVKRPDGDGKGISI